MRPYKRLIACLTLCLPALTCASSANAQQPHVHGHAELQIAVEGQRIDLILTSPAHNLLTFEHQPRTDQQKQIVSSATQWFNTHALITPIPGNCSVQSASLNFGATLTRHHPHNDDHHNHGDAIDQHANINVSQQLNCRGNNLGDRFSTPLFERFPELQKLSVEWVTVKSQGSTLLRAPDNQFKL